MKYYTLLIMQDGRWVIAFGDYNKDTVREEAEDSYNDLKCKIVTTKEDQASIDKRVQAENDKLKGA